MRRLAAVVVALALAAPAAAQQLAIEARPVECAGDALDMLIQSDPNPRIPVYGMGLGIIFLGCAPNAGPAVVSILNAMQGDVDILIQYEDAFPDVRQQIRSATCLAWWWIYGYGYGYALHQGGSDLVGGFPTPAERWADCERWSLGSSRRGR